MQPLMMILILICAKVPFRGDFSRMRVRQLTLEPKRSEHA